MILNRPTEVHGVRRDAGAIVTVDPHTAARLLDRARARLVDSADLPVILRHVERHRAGQLLGGAYVTRQP